MTPTKKPTMCGGKSQSASDLIKVSGFGCTLGGECCILKSHQQNTGMIIGVWSFNVYFVTSCIFLLLPAICGGAAVFGYYQTPSKLTLLQSRPTVTESRYTQGTDNQYRSWQARQNRIINRQCVST